MESRDNFLQCSVCSTEFDDNCRTPRILPCLHTFCSSCIQDLATKLEVECPDCDAKHGRPQNGISDYPIDIACRNFLDFIRVQQRPSEVPCTDCPDRDVAQTFCKDCSTFMCKECTNAHKRTQLTRKHLVVALTELKESGLDEFHRKETCNVRGHEDQSFTFYCDKRGCDKPVCTLCAVSEHNQTNGHVLRNLADVYEDGKAVIQNVITELNDKGSPIPEAMEKYQNFLQDLSMKENDVNKEIDRTFDKLQQILHERREQLHKDVQSQSQSRCKVLQDRIKELQSFNGDVVNATNFTSRVISYTNPTEFLQMKNHILKRLVELKSLSVSIPEKSDLGIKFAVGISEESFAQLVRGIGNISQSVNARKDLHLQINERDASYRHAYPVSNGVRESFESPRSDVSSSSRQVQQNISSPITNGPTTPVKYSEDRSMLSPRMVRLTSPKTVQDKPVVAPKTNSSNVQKTETIQPERRFRQAPSSLAKTDTKAPPMGLGDFLKSTFKPLADRTFQPVSPDRTSQNVASPITPTASHKVTTPITPTTGHKLASPRTPTGKFDPSKTIRSPEAKETPKSPMSPISPGGMNNGGTFGDVICPEFTFNVLTTHSEREVSMDGKILRNRKSGAPSGSSTIQNADSRLQQYKGVIGTFPFKDLGKYYYEVVVTFTIEEPLEETWLIFEMGLCRADDIDKHHTVERHEHARSFYVARYPEDGKLAQEFWHNRDLRSFVPLCDNVSGLTVEVTYGLLVDVKRKKWTIADVKKQKKLYTFMGVDFSEPLWPVFGSYNQDLVNVEMKIRSGPEISGFPAFLKGF